MNKAIIPGEPSGRAAGALVPGKGALRQACVRLLVAAEKPAPLVDPRAPLAAHEQEVGAASLRPLTGVYGRAEDRDHQLAGALIDIAGIAVGPDTGAGLGAHLDDVVAEHAAGEIDVSCPIRISPLVPAYCRGPPFPVGESGAEIIPRGNEA